ncbi:MAG: hypothetical protein ACRDZ5_03430 [Acidimicrobiales bacterium]
MASTYRDSWVECTDEEVRIRGYYFPWGTKAMAYASIKSMRRVDVGAFSGAFRIWGTSNPRYWASFDPKRPRKSVGFVLDLGHYVKPFVTPDDPEGFEAALRDHEVRPSNPADGKGPLLI